MNKARFAASAIAAAAVTITVGGAASGLWLYHHGPATSGRVVGLPRQRAPVLPRASSAPYPHPAIRDPATLHYVGAFERGAPWTYQPMARFASVAGRKPNITIYYSRWGDPFRARFATAAAQAGAVVLVHLEPRRESMVAIASGGWDRYLHRYAAQVRHYGGPVILSFAPEANGRWYPWGWHHTYPRDWVRAWRHVVTLFRASGATNVTWLWDVSAENRATGPLRDWWPGPEYVDWVGVDGYYFTPADTFASVIGRTVYQIREFASKPILLSEVGIGPLAGKAQKIPGLFAGLRHRHLLGLIWFDVTQHRGPYHQDWRLESDPAAVAAFRAGVRSLRGT
jgi:hypothetical protein